MQRLTEADRGSQRIACSCIDMHRQLGRQRERQRETERERDRERQRDTERDRERERQTERETGRGRQRQTETGRDRQRQAEPGRARERQRYLQRYIQVETDICREGRLEAKSYIDAVQYKPR